MAVALVPIITPLLGAGALGAVGEALVGVALSFGVSYIAKRLQPKPSTSATNTGMQLSMSTDPNGPRQFAFGRVASAGSLIYHNSYGPNGNDYLQVVVKLADFPCSALVNCFVDGTGRGVGSAISTSDVTGQPVTAYTNNLWLRFADGDWNQTADPDLVSKATGTSWSSNNIGRGVCYLRSTAKYDPELFKNGRPQIIAVFDGAKLYDWRKDSTNGGSGTHRWGINSTYEWSANPAVILYNYMRGLIVNGYKVGGMNVPAENLPLETWTAAANVCDEFVTKKSGVTERRYTANGITNLDGEHASFIRDVLASMAGRLVDAGGDFKLYAGAAQASVMTITDDDILTNKQVVYSPKLSRAQLVNAVFGSFTDPAKSFQLTSLPPRISPTDATSDGGNQLTENYALPFVISSTQGQRVLEIFRRRGRYQRSFSLPLRATFCVLEAGDWVTLNSTRYGLSNVTFEVTKAQVDRDMTVVVELRETSSSVYAFNAGIDELDPLDPADVGSGGTPFSSVSNVQLFNIIRTGTGTQQRPGLRVTWDAITDPTVIQIALEYRRVGNLTASERTILNPGDSSYEWVDGVQGGVQYEVRLKPITRPVRAVAFTGWVSVAGDAAPQIVAIAESATSVPPQTITHDMLSEQVRRELALVTAADTVLGSVNERFVSLQRQITDVSLANANSLLDASEANARVTSEKIERISQDIALAKRIDTVEASIGDAAALILEEQTARATADTALSESLLSVATSLGGLSAQVTVISQSINGIEAKFAIATTVNGEVLGIVALDANATAGSTFTVVANSFKVAQPGVTGGSSVPVFAIQSVNGVPQLALRGTLIADGTILARHLTVTTLSAITANLGTVTAGLIRDPGNTWQINLNTGQILTTDGAVLFDLKNRIFEMTF